MHIYLKKNNFLHFSQSTVSITKRFVKCGKIASVTLSKAFQMGPCGGLVLAH